jgi:hypothetical protein
LTEILEAMTVPTVDGQPSLPKRSGGVAPVVGVLVRGRGVLS